MRCSDVSLTVGSLIDGPPAVNHQLPIRSTSPRGSDRGGEMNPERLRDLLERVRSGVTDLPQALIELRHLPYQDLGAVSLDHHRALRQGVPEVVFGEGKSADQIALVVEELDRAGHDVLVTRMDPAKAAKVIERCPDLRYVPAARAARLSRKAVAERPCAPVAVICAGTSDVMVAEEAIETLAAVGIRSTRMFDVGVAGVHRLFDRLDQLDGASAAIVIAGMEGALPSLVGGLLACPIVAVPSSVGYGTALGGLTALFAMLTSCAAGVTVVNIDNGFGAAMALHRMLPKA
jgi:NCAIR mutase (PurE)-related protein